MLIATLLVMAAVATTGDATGVGLTRATLNGNVQGAQNAYFVYGTSTDYGLDTGVRNISDGPVTETVQGLTVDTTYHYRLVADDGSVLGADKTFRTGGPPVIGNQVTRGVDADSATATASVNPNGGETTYVIEWGTTTNYGRRTTATSVGSGREPTSVTVPLTGLRPFTRYHWRTVATNAAGIARGQDRSFQTWRQPSAVSIGLSRRTVPWGGDTHVGGRVSGIGVGGMTVALEQQRFLVDQGFTPLATAVTGRDGGYLFTIPALFGTTRYRVITQTQTPVTSGVVTARSAVKVDALARHRTRLRASVEGSVLPGVHGTASLQRYAKTTGWRQVKFKTVAPADEQHTPYRFSVKRPGRRAPAYRLRVVVAPVRGAHVRGTSRAVTVRPRPASN